MALKKIISISGSASIEHDGMRLSTGQSATVEAEFYVKVTHVAGDKTQQAATVAFITTDGSTLKQQFVLFEPTLEGGNYIKQAYEHLKTLPEFADAVDC